MPLTFESAEEREFWMKVYVQVAVQQSWDDAALDADSAVEELRKRTTATAPLSDGPKLTAAQDCLSQQSAARQTQFDPELAEFFARPVKVHVR